MKKLINLLFIVSFLLSACAPAAVSSIGVSAPMAHADHVDGHCESHEFTDGAVIEYCPPEASAIPNTETPVPGTETPVLTDTPIPSTATAEIVPTDTQNPPTETALPLPTDEPIAPHADAPLCPTHDNRAYHGLWDAARGCHYDHQHGDDPHLLDSVLGTDIYSKMGQNEADGYAEISYPWQTFSAAGLENDLKHAGYIWHVRNNIPCDGVPSPCVIAFRFLVHQHSVLDSAVQYHSYVFEGATSDGGYILYGGWVDFGDLHVPEGTVVVDAPFNSDANNCSGAGRHKQHFASGPPQIIWYGASRQTMDCGPRGFITISSTIHDAFVYTNPVTGGAGPYACYPAVNCRANATTHRPHLVGINMITRFAFIYDAQGRANWTGYADRYGFPQESSACTTYSADCSPVIFINLRRDYDYQTAVSATANSFHDHDIYFNGQTSGWAQPVP